MIQLDDLRIVVEAVDRGSFSAAAARLGLSKQVVSRRVMALEERLGARLLTRTTRRLSATEAGQQLVERGRRILADAEEAEQAVTSRGAAPRGRLRVSAPVSFGVVHLAPILPGFLSDHPGMELDIELNDRRVDLVGEGFDMAIRIGRLPDSTLVARKLGATRLTACCSPSYAARAGIPATPADLRHHECLLYGHGRVQDWQFRIGRHVRAVQVSGRLHANNGEMLRDAAVAGHGIAMMPSFISGPAVRSGRLLSLLEGYMLEPSGVYAITPQHRQVSTMCRVFADVVQAGLAAAPGWEDGLG